LINVEIPENVGMLLEAGAITNLHFKSTSLCQFIMNFLGLSFWDESDELYQQEMSYKL